MSLNQSFISDFSEYYRWSQRTKIKYKLHYMVDVKPRMEWIGMEWNVLEWNEKEEIYSYYLFHSNPRLWNKTFCSTMIKLR